MSIEAMNWAWDQAEPFDLKQSEINVLLLLANYAHQEDKGEAKAAVKRATIAKRCNMSSLDTVRKWTKSLEDKGLIRREINACKGFDREIPKDKRPNIYTLLMNARPLYMEGSPPSIQMPRDPSIWRGSTQEGTQVEQKRRSAASGAVANPPNDGLDDPPPTQQLAIQPASETPTEAEQLCTEFAEAVTEFSDRHNLSWPKPKFHTKTNLAEMDKLIRLGTSDPDVEGEPVTPEQIRRLIRAMHEQLCNPEGQGNFCWSYVTRSPKKLRRNWEQIRTELNARRNPATPQRKKTGNVFTDMEPDEGTAFARAIVARLDGKPEKSDLPQIEAGS